MKSAQQEKFKGTFTALLTPMLEDGEIDFQSLERSVEHQLRLGTKGFYVGGSTGEGFLLSSDERMQILETVVRANAGRGTVIAHVGCISTRETVRLAKHAAQHNVDAISAVVPFYYKLSMTEIQHHYEEVMASTATPMIIYHFPGATGVSLTMDFYEQMAKHPQCIGVKFTSLNLFEMEQIRAKCGTDFLVFNGHDEIYAGGALMGADGAIGSTFNIMPGLFAQLYQMAEAGQWGAMRELQSKANEIITELVAVDVLAFEKYVMYLQGVSRTPMIRGPLKQLSAEEKKRIERFFNTSDILRTNSFKNLL
ncbi:MAG: N-acetylneuraminate lyase [Paenibacillus sp.]|jgi:N-acetylneuraminate lyase|nr:N-acetylneuraminate lyase [Paenibacillus sp.]